MPFPHIWTCDILGLYSAVKMGLQRAVFNENLRNENPDLPADIISGANHGYTKGSGDQSNFGEAVEASD
jgi:hypothetical protein